MSMREYNYNCFGVDSNILTKIDENKYVEWIKNNYKNLYDEAIAEKENIIKYIENYYEDDFAIGAFLPIKEYMEDKYNISFEHYQSDENDNYGFGITESYPWNLGTNKNLKKEDIEKMFQQTITPLLKNKYKTCEITSYCEFNYYG